MMQTNQSPSAQRLAASLVRATTCLCVTIALLLCSTPKGISGSGSEIRIYCNGTMEFNVADNGKTVGDTMRMYEISDLVPKAGLPYFQYGSVFLKW